MNLLIPDTGLLFWMLLSFGVVLVVLLRWGFPVILRAIEQRRAHIDSSLAAAQSAEERLATVEKQVEELLRGAAHDQAAILDQARLQAAMLIKQAREQADHQAQERRARAENEADELKNKALSNARDEIAHLAVQVASRIVGQQLRGNGEQQKFIERLLHEELRVEN